MNEPTRPPLTPMPTESDSPTAQLSELPTRMLSAVPPPSKTTKQPVHPRIIIAIVLVSALLVIAIPSSVLAYSTYSSVKSLALDGVRHLEAIKSKLPAGNADFGKLFDSATIAALQPDIQAAQNDFTRLNDELNQSPIIGLAGALPGLSGKVSAVRHLAHMGLDLTQIAALLMQVARTLDGILHRSPLNASVPFLTVTDLSQLSATMDAFSPLIADISMQAHGANLGSLLSASQQALLNKLLADLPKIQSALATARQFMKVAPAALGLTAPVTYLVVAMDRSELRASGGFQGNYALATVKDGRLTGTLKLTDSYLLDRHDNGCWNWNSSAPARYQSWWIYGCWGLRDANLSADFPTTARMSLQLFSEEGGGQAQGMIAITPQIIQQMLDITGPIYIGYGYNVTVTAGNLEATIHRFQEHYTGQGGTDLPPPDQLSSTRKRFTALLGRALQDRLHSLPQSKLISLARQALDDLKTKDIQIYSANSTVEQFLTAQHVDSTMQRGPGDGLFVVDTNLSGKQNTFVQEQIADTVQLGDDGSALHSLKLTYNFVNPTNAPTYPNFPGYRDYLRVYVPAGSTLLSSDTAGIGALTSDEPQRAMWGGFVYVYQNAGPLTITLRWRVPGVVKGGLYQYAIQKQAGNHITVTLIIQRGDPAKTLLSYATPAKQTFDQDKQFSITNT